MRILLLLFIILLTPILSTTRADIPEINTEHVIQEKYGNIDFFENNGNRVLFIQAITGTIQTCRGNKYTSVKNISLPYNTIETGFYDKSGVLNIISVYLDFSPAVFQLVDDDLILNSKISFPKIAQVTSIAPVNETHMMYIGGPTDSQYNSYYFYGETQIHANTTSKYIKQEENITYSYGYSNLEEIDSFGNINEIELPFVENIKGVLLIPTSVTLNDIF